MSRLPRLPDLLTTANLSCGVASILLASQGQLTIACGLVFLAALFDVLDGLAARALGGGSEFGKQLDSLADMVSFGVAPMFAVLFTLRWPPLGNLEQVIWLPLLLAAIPIASAWRLAKFNVDARQREGFLGLPTPFNALFWVSVCLATQHVPLYGMLNSSKLEFAIAQLVIWPSLPIMVIGLSGLMLSSLPLPSLKFKHYRWRGNEVIYCLLLAACCLLLLYGVLAVPLILIIYLLSPLWGRLLPKPA